MNRSTVTFTFDSEYVDQDEIIDHYCDVCDENRYLIVYVDDVDNVLIENLTDEQLCEFLGLSAEFLVSSNRSDLL